MALLDNSAGTNDAAAGVQALQAVNVPNLASLTLPQLKQYVVSGVLTPQQYQAIQENPQAYSQAIQASQDNTGKNAQSSALQQLGGIIQAGGSTPINQANLLNNINQTNQAMQAARGGIQQQAQQQGVSGGGQEFLNELMNEQQNSQNANTGAVNAAANNAQLALNAIGQQGTLGGQMQGQANQMSQAQADAAAQIAQYNSQLQSQANQYNTQNANQAQQLNLANTQNVSAQNTGLNNQRTLYNAQLPETVFNNQLQKASDVANAYNNMGQQAQQEQAQNNAMTGKLIGTAGTVIGGMYGGPAGAAAGGAAGNAIAGSDAVSGGSGSTPTAGSYNALPSSYGIGSGDSSSYYNQGGDVNVTDPNTGLKASAQPIQMNKGGMCYAQGGEVHDHEICMQIGGPVPGDSTVPGDSPENDTVHAKLSPHEIVLPTSVSQAPNAPGKAANFVAQIKGKGPIPPGIMPPGMPPGLNPTVNSFAEVLAKLEANGLELRLAPKGD